MCLVIGNIPSATLLCVVVRCSICHSALIGNCIFIPILAYIKRRESDGGPFLQVLANTVRYCAVINLRGLEGLSEAAASMCKEPIRRTFMFHSLKTYWLVCTPLLQATSLVRRSMVFVILGRYRLADRHITFTALFRRAGRRRPQCAAPRKFTSK
jgi:hypothetical protein